MYAFYYCLATAAAVSAAVLPRATSPVHLAVSPKCGKLSSGKVADVNSGLAKTLSQYKTVVALGDSYSASQNGAGMSNGPVWIEQLATAAGAQFIDYSANHALIDASSYPDEASTNTTTDFTHQVEDLIADHPSLDPSTTLYTVFFGMEDFIKSDGFTTIPYTTPATNLAFGVLELVSAPLSAKNVLFVDNYGRGETTPQGQQYKQGLFTALNTLQNRFKTNVGFIDFANIWTGVLGSTPGFQAFGYTSSGTCVSASGAVCADPDHTFYYTDGNPTAATHKIMADYVNQVLTTC